MRNKRIRNDVKFSTRITSDKFAVYSEGFVIYDDDVIPFGKVILSSDLGNASGGHYLYDDKYIYACLVSGTISSIFDLDNRCEIDCIHDLISLREKAYTKKIHKRMI